MKGLTMSTIRIIGFSLILTACGSSHDDGHEHSVDDGAQISEGCKPLMFGPDLALDLTMGSPAATATHTRYVLTLAESEDAPGTFEGSFSFTATASRHYLIADQDVPVSVVNSDGDRIDPVTYQMPVTQCDQAGRVTQVDLEADTYTINISESTTAELQMVVHVFGDDHDHDH